MIHGLQYIAADGTKKFRYGSAVTGHFFLVGDQAAESDPLYIAEGFATAASIHEATGVQTAVAFNTGNLEAVTQALHQQWPGRPIVLCADADAPGQACARAAAQAVGGTVASPNFGSYRPNGATDFNDLLIYYGPAAVADSIQNAQCAFPALENLVEQSIADPGYVFRPDVVEQLGRFRTADRAQFETLRAGLKQKTKCRVTHLDQAIDQKSKPDGDNGNAGLADQLVALASEALSNWDDVFVSVWDSNFKEAFADLTDEGRRETWPVPSSARTSLFHQPPALYHPGVQQGGRPFRDVHP